MLKIMRWDDYPGDEIAERAAGKPYLQFPDTKFDVRIDWRTLGDDPWFQRILREVDDAEVADKGIVRMLKSGRPHTFEQVSTGVKVLWLMYHYPDEFLYPSQWLGENCYQQAVDIGAEKDIIVFDDSDMLCREYRDYALDNCHGQFQDFMRGTIYTLVPGGEAAWEFALMKGVNVAGV